MLCIESQKHNWSLQDQSPGFTLYSKEKSFASICVKNICMARSNARGVFLLRLSGEKTCSCCGGMFRMHSKTVQYGTECFQPHHQNYLHFNACLFLVPLADIVFGFRANVRSEPKDVLNSEGCITSLVPQK